MSCKNWNNPDRANIAQENNSAEAFVGAILRDRDPAERREIYLETCGPSAFEAAVDGLGIDQGFVFEVQPSDWYTIWLNDPARRFPSGWTKPKNRYLEAYPRLVEEFFGDEIEASVLYWNENIDERVLTLRSVLSAPQSVLMLLLKNPGHFITALHIDSNDVVTYNEPWKANPWNPGTARKRTVKLADLVTNLKYGALRLREK